MPKVEIKQGKIRVGAKAYPLISGEVHYWRLNPSCWKTILDRIKALDLDIIATYVPWEHHEHKRGHFDFTGETDETRNLKGFLELARKEGFKVIIRPGPYIYSEWPNDGVPDYARKHHRLHPQFMASAKEYMRAVCKVIKPYLATNPKGHILMFQACNEIDPWPDMFGHQYGLSGKAGLFQNFLRGKYKNRIKDLNENWGEKYKRFEDAGPYIACMLPNERGLPLKGDHELRRNLDYIEFKHQYCTQYADWCVKEYRKLGIDVPIYVNLYPFFYVQDWAKMEEVSDLAGIDLYPSSELAEDKHEQRKMMDKIRYTALTSKLPYIAEFASGVWHARHYETGVLTPNHYRIMALTAMLGGVKGWNWYMLVNRDNWYMSPINEWGRIREELYQVFHDVVRTFKAFDPATLERLCDVAVTFDPLQYAGRTIQHDDLVQTRLYEADIDYELYDPKLDKPLGKKILFYSGNQWMSRKAQERLLDYVKAGGILVAFRDYPRKDENFKPCNVIGFHDPSSILFEFKKKLHIALDKKHKVDVVSSVYAFGPVSGRKITAQADGYGALTVGYIKTIGKGKVLHLGVEATPKLVVAVLEAFRVPLYAHSSTTDVHTALYKRAQKYYVVAVNNGMEDKSATIYLPGVKFSSKRFKVKELITNRVEHVLGNRTPALSVELPRKDGRVFEISKD